MSDLTREQAVEWCRTYAPNMEKAVFPPPSGWMWCNHGNGVALTAIFTITDAGEYIISTDLLP